MVIEWVCVSVSLRVYYGRVTADEAFVCILTGKT
jgi:hypothetical protein